jgi:hypothetical protein
VNKKLTPGKIPKPIINKTEVKEVPLKDKILNTEGDN